jgi:hypothetical protein
MSPEVLADRVEVRLRRQSILDRDSPPRYRVFIDESVLHRPTGGPEVMVAQIDKILDLIEQKRVTAQIVPFDVGVVATQDSNFVLLEFDDKDLSPVVFVESLQNGQMFEKEVDLARYRESIDYLRDSALNPTATRARLIEARKAYESASR